MVFDVRNFGIECFLMFLTVFDVRNYGFGWFLDDFGSFGLVLFCMFFDVLLGCFVFVVVEVG